MKTYKVKITQVLYAELEIEAESEDEAEEIVIDELSWGYIIVEKMIDQKIKIKEKKGE